MEKADFYDLLGVSRDADAATLKKAYRKLAMECHPDRNPDDHAAEARFKDLNEAYEILKDDQKRAAYDRYGHAAFENGGAGPGAGGFRGGFDFASGFADIFDEMFGDFTGARRGNTATRGADLRYNMEISLEDAFRGREPEIRLPTSVACNSCDGSGAEGGAQPVSCPSCHGAGRVRAQQGFFTIERTCPNCQGQGRVIDRPCGTCRGTGRERKEKTLAVKIPPGVEDGNRIRVPGEGEAGLRGGPPGDLYIFLSVALHPLFRREGDDLYCRVPLPMTVAALGGAIEVPTIEGGRAKVNIPAGAQTGHRLRLRNKGMAVLRSKNRGDMYIEAEVETPVKLTKRQKELLAEFESAGGGHSEHQPQHHGFFAKVRDFWDDLTE
jgi:molecular chaperone DnaJ